MPNSVLQYDLLISCPEDAEESVKTIESAVEEFNQHFSDVLGISIRCRYWKKSVFAESGGTPQELINKQIVNKSDLAVAVFKTRFGAPTDKYGSGTEEEIEQMLSDNKQVFLFFDESPCAPALVATDEYKRIIEFKKRYSDRGIYWSFNSQEDFRKILFAQISRYFLGELKNKNYGDSPELVIKAVNNGKIEDIAEIMKFDLGNSVSSEVLAKNVRDEIYRINEMPINRSGSSEGIISLNGSVEVGESTIDLIKTIASVCGVVLKEDFFDIGNLKRSVIYFNKDLIGDVTEKNKYNAIMALKHSIICLNDQTQAESVYGQLHGIVLVISNEGTSFDEDVDVDILIKKDMYISYEELVPSEELNMSTDWSFSDVFEIQSTKDYLNYCDSKREIHVNPVPASAFPFANGNLLDGYRDVLEEIFDYQVFDADEYYVIRTHFDYIKQHQSVAFPTWLFMKNYSGDFELRYKITSKNSREVIDKQITVCCPKEG